MESDLVRLGETLASIRRSAGISQRALAEMVGTSQQQIARWEASSYRTAALERVQAIAHALDASAGEPLAAAEAPAVYATQAAPATGAVRDLGGIAARLRAHSEELKNHYRIERVAVFGSFARGEQLPRSDVDLLVECSDPGGFRFVEAVLFLEDLLGREVDVARPHLLKAALRERVENEAVYVWPAG